MINPLSQDGLLAVQRGLGYGSAYRIVKVPYRSVDLVARLGALGWQVAVAQTSGAFYWGAGGRARPR